jgi:hypothetical protein
MADTINTCIRSLLSSRTFHDLDLVCVDGTLSYPKLLAGLVFPSLSTCNILKFPSHHTLLLPDFTVTDVMKIVETVLGNNRSLLYILEIGRGVLFFEAIASLVVTFYSVSRSGFPILTISYYRTKTLGFPVPCFAMPCYATPRHAMICLDMICHV